MNNLQFQGILQKILHKVKDIHKRNAKIIAKFDNSQTDQHITSLITTLKALGSL